MKWWEEPYVDPGLVHEHEKVEDCWENVEIVAESDQEFHKLRIQESIEGMLIENESHYKVAEDKSHIWNEVDKHGVGVLGCEHQGKENHTHYEKGDG